MDKTKFPRFLPKLPPPPAEKRRRNAAHRDRTKYTRNTKHREVLA